MFSIVTSQRRLLDDFKEHVEKYHQVGSERAADEAR